MRHLSDKSSQLGDHRRQRGQAGRQEEAPCAGLRWEARGSRRGGTWSGCRRRRRGRAGGESVQPELHSSIPSQLGISLSKQTFVFWKQIHLSNPTINITVHLKRKLASHLFLGVVVFFHLVVFTFFTAFTKLLSNWRFNFSIFNTILLFCSCSQIALIGVPGNQMSFYIHISEMSLLWTSISLTWSPSRPDPRPSQTTPRQDDLLTEALCATKPEKFTFTFSSLLSSSQRFTFTSLLRLNQIHFHFLLIVDRLIQKQNKPQHMILLPKSAALCRSCPASA